MNTNKRKTTAVYIGFCILFALSAVFLLYKCRFGFGNNDESFYLATPLRLYQGDSLFVSEWHLSQMSSVLLLPFVSLYMTVFRSTAGIIMSFRYLYILLHAAVSVYIFSALKKTNIFGAALSSLAVFLYAPFNINALSYNSMGIDCLVLSCLLLYTAKEKSRLKPALSGIFYAFSVLCCPYLAVIYAVYSIAVFIRLILKKKASKDFCFLEKKFWMFFNAGVFAAAAVFLIFVLSRASVTEIFKAMPYILDDPEHKSMGLAKKFSLYYKSIFCLTDFSTEIVFIIFFLILMISFLDKKRDKNRAVYLIIYSIISVSLFVIYSRKMDYINLTVLPLNFLALGCVPLFRDNASVRKLFLTVWIPGFIYTFCIHLSSNELYLAIGSASVVSLAGSLAIIAAAFSSVISENKGVLKAAVSVVVAAVITVQFASLVYKRYSDVFWEDSLDVLTEEIGEGVEKGVITSPYKKGEYEKLLKAKKYIDEKYSGSDSILFFSEYTWSYLIFDGYRNAGFSAWLSGADGKSFERLKSFYALNPDMLPDLIYIDKINSEYSEKFISEYGYKSEIFETGAVILSR